MTIFPRVIPVDNTTLQQVELLYIYFDIYPKLHFYYHCSIKTTPSNNYLLHPNNAENKNYTYKLVRVDSDRALENSTYGTNLFFKLSIAVETTGGDSLWLNLNNELHKRIIKNMF